MASRCAAAFEHLPDELLGPFAEIFPRLKKTTNIKTRLVKVAGPYEFFASDSCLHSDAKRSLASIYRSARITEDTQRDLKPKQTEER